MAIDVVCLGCWLCQDVFVSFIDSQVNASVRATQSCATRMHEISLAEIVLG